MCEGKEHAIAIGTMVMEPEEIKNVNKGIGIEVAHYLNDGLWHLKHVKWMFCTEKTLLEKLFWNFKNSDFKNGRLGWWSILVL